MIRALYNNVRGWLRRQRTFYRLRREYRAFLNNPSPYRDMKAQELLRQGFLDSKGKSLLWAHNLQKKRTPHRKGPISSTCFPSLDETTAAAALSQLRTNGVYVFPWRMPEEWVREAIKAAEQLKVVSRDDESDVQFPFSIAPKCATYWHGSDVAEIPQFSDLVNDLGIREIIGRYLECEPVFDLVAAWWSFPSGAASSKSAQLYHFDMDRVRWLKVFVYLTDVGLDNGPHAFIQGSHRTIGSKVMHDGRYSDDEVFRMYPKQDEIILTGPAGTVFIEDTLGFHKGLPVQSGKRFVFEYEYSINSFGYPY